MYILAYFLAGGPALAKVSLLVQKESFPQTVLLSLIRVVILLLDSYGFSFVSILYLDIQVCLMIT